MNQNAKNFVRIAQGKHPYGTSIHKIHNYSLKGLVPTPSPINAKSDLYVYVCSFTLNFVLTVDRCAKSPVRRPENPKFDHILNLLSLSSDNAHNLTNEYHRACYLFLYALIPTSPIRSSAEFDKFLQGSQKLKHSNICKTLFCT